MKNEDVAQSNGSMTEWQTEVIPFLSLNGRAAEAIAFYEQKLGAKVWMKVSYADMAKMDESFEYAEEQKDWITHSVLQIGANKLMIAEEALDLTKPWSSGNEFSLCIQSRNHDAIVDLYERLTSDSRTAILAPLAANSFSTGYGAVRDPFGVVFQFTVTRHEF
ncbi:VOC family protein [Saccharibacillus sp. JS10]|uniref:VOC family protein n=1 Tax=Saccharibacillus sp. JS10 TaxID=2950552 RepID=UPI002109AF5C|nr:VOC family protein [Saccharibacillus sp. JS10]MCQ4088461.1 VOC family protein [Saccharibacillus sp. JS10]